MTRRKTGRPAAKRVRIRGRAVRGVSVSTAVSRVRLAVRVVRWLVKVLG